MMKNIQKYLFIGFQTGVFRITMPRSIKRKGQKVETTILIFWSEPYLSNVIQCLISISKIKPFGSLVKGVLQQQNRNKVLNPHSQYLHAVCKSAVTVVFKTTHKRCVSISTNEGL